MSSSPSALKLARWSLIVGFLGTAVLIALAPRHPWVVIAFGVTAAIIYEFFWDKVVVTWHTLWSRPMERVRMSRHFPELQLLAGLASIAIVCGWLLNEERKSDRELVDLQKKALAAHFEWDKLDRNLRVGFDDRAAKRLLHNVEWDGAQSAVLDAAQFDRAQVLGTGYGSMNVAASSSSATDDLRAAVLENLKARRVSVSQFLNSKNFTYDAKGNLTSVSIPLVSPPVVSMAQPKKKLHHVPVQGGWHAGFGLPPLTLGAVTLRSYALQPTDMDPLVAPWWGLDILPTGPAVTDNPWTLSGAVDWKPATALSWSAGLGLDSTSYHSTYYRGAYYSGTPDSLGGGGVYFPDAHSQRPLEVGKISFDTRF